MQLDETMHVVNCDVTTLETQHVFFTCHKTAMDATRDTDATLKAILALNELKKDTAVTRNIVNSAEKLLTLNKEKEIHLQ